MRASVAGDNSMAEVAYIPKSGKIVLGSVKDGKRFYIQRVKAGIGGSFWATVEIAMQKDYAVSSATNRAVNEQRSYRVATNK